MFFIECARSGCLNKVLVTAFSSYGLLGKKENIVLNWAWDVYLALFVLFYRRKQNTRNIIVNILHDRYL